VRIDFAIIAEHLEFARQLAWLQTRRDLMLTALGIRQETGHGLPLFQRRGTMPRFRAAKNTGAVD
jgi:hypothetical protein